MNDEKLVMPIFHFDQATIHAKRARDALNVKNMNKRPGDTHVNVMKDGWYWNGLEKVVQKMFFMEGDEKFLKGSQMVLEESG